jgi:nucleoside-diphosphate-sugar epimerase
MNLTTITPRDFSDVMQNSRVSLEQFRGKSIFFTGATGFFGKWMTQILMGADRELKLDFALTIICRNREKVLDEQPWLNHSSVEIISADIRNFPIINKHFDYFIHGATAASASLNDAHPEIMADTIIEGTKRVLLQASLSNKPRFLFLSSGAVYGAQQADVLKAPEDLTTGPNISQASSAYGEAKRMAELYCQFAQTQNKITLSVARCYAFLGPYLPIDQHFAAGNFIKNVLERQTITLSGDGLPFRSYMYPTDLVEWLLAILVNASEGAVFNVGSDQEIQLKDLAEMMNHERSGFELGIQGKGVEVLGVPCLGSKRNAYVPSTDKAKKELGLKIRVDLAQAIQRTISWHINSGERIK